LRHRQCREPRAQSTTADGVRPVAIVITITVTVTLAFAVVIITAVPNVTAIA